MGKYGRSDGSFDCRKATEADLDAITKVVQRGFPDDPEFNYRFPYRQDYPEDNRKWVRCEYKGYIEQPEKFVVLVVTAPIVGGDGSISKQPIAVGVWDVAVEIQATGGGLNGGINTRRDADPVHMKEYARALSSGFDRFFAQYGNDQMHLWLLVTDPDFRRRGAGTMLCNWGLQEARKKGCILTVLASPMGRFLYERLNYKLIGAEKVQANEEDYTFDVYCLERQTNDYLSDPSLEVQ